MSNGKPAEVAPGQVWDRVGMGMLWYEDHHGNPLSTTGPGPYLILRRVVDERLLWECLSLGDGARALCGLWPADPLWRFLA